LRLSPFLLKACADQCDIRRIDLRVAGTPEEASPRELGAALVLNDLLRRAGQFEPWQRFDRVLQTFVGKTDSLTFAQLGAVLTKSGIASPADVKDLEALAALQADILAGKHGLQQVRSAYFESDPNDSRKVELPRSFTVMGQKFAVDSWVLSKVVYDDILWDGGKVQRRVPSCLDVAFAALGNDQVVPELAARMKDAKGREFRDGLNYQHNLAAVRNVVDDLKPAVWDEALYTGWLASLRELSRPTTAAKYPEAMRTRAWAMKSLNTQMGSWTELRHDTVLYVKQSYTEGVTCFYPAGYVEPVAEFWARLGQMANRAADLLAETPFPDREVKIEGQAASTRTGKAMQESYVGHFRNFAKQVAVLQGIAEKELAQKELTKEESQFLGDTVEVSRGCGGPRTYTGWYPGLYYGGGKAAEKWDALVADVHTDVPSEVEPGCVLHEGVGNVDLLLIAVDNGKDRMVYAGPVMSHYEFEMPGVSRKSDSEWRKEINAGQLPPRPEWTKAYLVPGSNPEAAGYRAE
jgi:hypothetical protein